MGNLQKENLSKIRNDIVAHTMAIDLLLTTVQMYIPYVPTEASDETTDR